MEKNKKIILAYSGGLDTSVIIPWLIENYNAKVIAVVADLGQNENLNEIKKKAIRNGASKVYVEDLKKEFVKEFLFRMIKANAIYEGKYLLGTSIARPLIAKRIVEIAKSEDAQFVSHGCTGKGNDQVRFELTFKILNPKLKIIAPWREWNLKSREDEIEYALKKGIQISASLKKPYSIDRNIWHISFEGGILEDTWKEPDEDMFILTNSVEKTPGKPTYIDIEFVQGEPKKLNGKSLEPVELIKKLNLIAGKNGIGRTDLVENRLVGIKSRGVYECPAGTCLFVAHRELESITLDRETMRFKEFISLKYSELIYYGMWYTTLKSALDSFIDKTQKNVTGIVRLKLFKGNCIVAGRKSEYSLYKKNLATFGKGEKFNQKYAEGFINLFSLPYIKQ